MIYTLPEVSDTPIVANPPAAPAIRSGLLRNSLIFLAFLGIVVMLQMVSGAYRSEFGAYPDEPAHYVTSLMVREYLVGPNFAWPMKFAENYYAHYPKVAIGHWPPVFYAIQAIWMLLFSASRASVRLELAVTTAVLGFSVFAEAQRWFRQGVAILTGLITVCIPLVQASADEEMAEMLLALTCFWSAVYFARYVDSERRRDALWFAVFFSLAVLTKGSGWLLIFIPPVALLLTKKVQLFFRSSFWIAVSLAAVCCLPWQILTLQVAKRGWTGGSNLSWRYTSSALIQFSHVLISVLGPVLTVVAILGIAVWVCVPLMRARRCASMPAVMLALLLGDWIFHSIVPAGVESRKMIMAVPALVLFLAAGGVWIANLAIARKTLGRFHSPLVAAALALIFFAQTFAVPRETQFGYIQVAKFLTLDPALKRATILASSESGGEGFLISEIAMREPSPTDKIIRATKALADVDWSGMVYRPLYTTPQQLLRYIDQAHIEIVVTDNNPPTNSFFHANLLLDAIRDNPDRFELLKTFPGASPSGQIRVFRVRRRASIYDPYT